MAVNANIISKIKHIEIFTKKLVRGLLQGQTRSSLKGSGFDFDQIRDYQEGDDIRSIDWKSSARANKIVVKQFREEKTRTILLALDISASTSFFSTGVSKQERMAQVAAILGLVGSYTNDAVGLLLFADEIITFMPPAKGKAHMHELLEKIFLAQVAHKKTNISLALNHIAALKQKDMMVFLMSDFIDIGFEKALSHVAAKHEVIAVFCNDPREIKMPTAGFLTLRDLENGEIITLDLHGKSSEELQHFLLKRTDEQDMLFKKCGIDRFSPGAPDELVGNMISFFKRRMIR